MNDLLKQLTEAVGVSSGEHEVRRLLRDLIAPHVDEWRVDSLGNLIALKKGSGPDAAAFTVAIDAHMDEVGLMVTGIDTDGGLQFAAVGGFDDRALLGKVVQIGPQKITGVIGARAVHLLSSSEQDTIVTRSKMRIDIGATKKENAARKVHVGDLAAFTTPYRELGPTAIGKSFDDRAGCAALVELLRGDPYPFNLVAVFSVQEEVGLRGATAAGFGLQPDAAIVLECTPAYDLPYDQDDSPNVRLGQGPAIYVMDGVTIQDPRLVSHLMRTAAAQAIPYQIRRPGGGGTNAASYQRAGAAVRAATVAVPGVTPTRHR